MEEKHTNLTIQNSIHFPRQIANFLLDWGLTDCGMSFCRLQTSTSVACGKYAPLTSLLGYGTYFHVIVSLVTVLYLGLKFMPHKYFMRKSKVGINLQSVMVFFVRCCRVFWHCKFIRLLQLVNSFKSILVLFVWLSSRSPSVEKSWNGLIVRIVGSGWNSN